MASTPAPLRIGILGAARIARLFCAGIQPSSLIKATGVAARDPARATEFAKDFNLQRVFQSYDAMLADADIDAVYIPLPNGLHAEWAIKAANARKHVLSEKPLATSEAEAKEMYAAARRNGVILVEGYPYLAQPQTQKARELVSSGAIGKLKLIRTSFGVPFDDLTDIRFSNELAGGSIMDAGAYAVSMIRVLAGERPARVYAIGQMAPTGVDRAMIASIEFKSGLLAQVASSFSTAYHRHAHICGDAGVVETTFLNHPPLAGPPTVHVRRGGGPNAEIETITTEGGNGFLGEGNSFANLISQGPAHWSGVTEQESCDIAATLEALVSSVKTGQPVTLPPA